MLAPKELNITGGSTCTVIGGLALHSIAITQGNPWYHAESLLHFIPSFSLSLNISFPFLTLSWRSSLLHWKRKQSEEKCLCILAPSTNLPASELVFCLLSYCCGGTVHVPPRLIPFSSIQEHGSSNFLFSFLHHEGFPFDRIILGRMMSLFLPSSKQNQKTLTPIPVHFTSVLWNNSLDEEKKKVVLHSLISSWSHFSIYCNDLHVVPSNDRHSFHPCSWNTSHASTTPLTLASPPVLLVTSSKSVSGC